MSLAAERTLATLEPHERPLAIGAARALRETQRQMVTSIGRRGRYSRLDVESADDVVSRAGLPLLRQVAVLRGALDYATAKGWYETGAYAEAVNGGGQTQTQTEGEATMGQMDTERVKEGIRELLRADERATTREVRDRLEADGHVTNTNLPRLVTEVRQELGIRGKRGRRFKAKLAARKAPAKRGAARATPAPAAAEAAAPRHEPEPEPTPARQPSEEAEAAQPPEADDEQPSPTPPPAAPVAEDEDDECPKGDPECLAPDDGEWHSHEACEAPEALPLPQLDLSNDGEPQLWITYRTGEDFGLVDRRSGAVRLVSITMPPIPTVSQWEIIKRYAELAT